MADKLTDKQRLQLADALLGSDIGLDANCVDALQQGSRSERDFARLITRLYRLIHPASECLSEHCRPMAAVQQSGRKL